MHIKWAHSNLVDRNVSYAPDRKDGTSPELVLASPISNGFEAEDAKIDKLYQAPHSEHFGYQTGIPPEQYHQYDAPTAKYEPPQGPPAHNQYQYASPDPSSPQMTKMPYLAYDLFPPVGVAGPSSGATSSQRTDKASPSFPRTPPSGLPYNAFPPTYLIAVRGNVTRGFPLMPPLSPMVPHPFATHDVNESDWTRFGSRICASKAAVLICTSRFLLDLHRISSIRPPKPLTLLCPQGLISSSFPIYYRV